jgi:hypothetical protein
VIAHGSGPLKKAPKKPVSATAYGSNRLERDEKSLAQESPYASDCEDYDPSHDKGKEKARDHEMPTFIPVLCRG